MVMLEQPSLSGNLQQTNAYLYRLQQQLQYALDTLSAAPTAGTGGQRAQEAAPGSSPSGNVPGGSLTQNPEQALDTFAGIKQLIIKSADIVNAYSETIQKDLEGVYVGQSEFGEFRNQTNQNITANSTGIEQLFTNTQKLSGVVGVIQAKQQSTDAYIKTGLLGSKADGTPIYGIEVGQQNEVEGVKTFDKFARFTADRLSFFDTNDVEVAYVSDYRLYITNAQVTGTLELAGKFRIFYQRGLTFQWIGGDA